MTYLRLGIQFALFVIYAIYFGRISVNKYLNSGVIITRDEVNRQIYICLHQKVYLAIMLVAENASTGGGWKTETHLNFCEDDDFLTVKSLKDCLLGRHIHLIKLL